MSFGGFSEDDIRKLTKAQEKGIPKTPVKKVTFINDNKKKSHNSNKLKLRNNGLTTSNNSHNQVQNTEELPVDAKLTMINEEATVDDISSKHPLAEPVSDKPQVKLEIEETSKHVKKFRDLGEFEARQKLIEEQNRKRKELLAKALADRTRQTQEEAARLREIQEEFKKLDAILSNDVKILRKEIEVASVEYHESEKRYRRIEKEYLEAKVQLHQKQEKKEMLTEHLCAIIEKNEERKADKLTELLHKLEMDPQKADLCIAEPQEDENKESNTTH